MSLQHILFGLLAQGVYGYAPYSQIARQGAIQQVPVTSNVPSAHYGTPDTAPRTTGQTGGTLSNTVYNPVPNSQHLYLINTPSGHILTSPVQFTGVEANSPSSPQFLSIPGTASGNTQSSGLGISPQSSPISNPQPVQGSAQANTVTGVGSQTQITGNQASPTSNLQSSSFQGSAPINNVITGASTASNPQPLSLQGSAPTNTTTGPGPQGQTSGVKVISNVNALVSLLSGITLTRGTGTLTPGLNPTFRSTGSQSQTSSSQPLSNAIGSRTSPLQEAASTNTGTVGVRIPGFQSPLTSNQQLLSVQGSIPTSVISGQFSGNQLNSGSQGPVPALPTLGSRKSNASPGFVQGRVQMSKQTSTGSIQTPPGSAPQSPYAATHLQPATEPLPIRSLLVSPNAFLPPVQSVSAQPVTQSHNHHSAKASRGQMTQTPSGTHLQNHRQSHGVHTSRLTKHLRTTPSASRLGGASRPPIGSNFFLPSLPPVRIELPFGAAKPLHRTPASNQGNTVWVGQYLPRFHSPPLTYNPSPLEQWAIKSYTDDLVEKPSTQRRNSYQHKVVANRRRTRVHPPSQTLFIQPFADNALSGLEHLFPDVRTLSAAQDLDCETIPEVLGLDVYKYRPMGCDDDQCPAGKECRTLQGVGMCCPSSVTSTSINTRSYIGSFDY